MVWGWIVTAILDTRFRPLTIEETADADALSVHGIYTARENANVLKAYACAPVLIPGQYWNGGYIPQPGVHSVFTADKEYYLAKWPPVPLPRGFQSLRGVIGADIQAGGGDSDLRLYSDVRPFYGPDEEDSLLTSSFSAAASVTSAIVVSGTFAYYTFTLGSASAPLNTTPFSGIGEPNIHLTLTHSPSAAATRVRVWTLSVWCDGSTVAT